jgi:hypothetical protein
VLGTTSFRARDYNLVDDRAGEVVLVVDAGASASERVRPCAARESHPGESTLELKKQGATGAPNQLTTADIQNLMGTMQDWFPQSDAQENADLDGEAATRVTGKLDLSKALTDLKAPAGKPGMSGAEQLKQLSGGDIKRIERMVSDPKFTIDVGESDGKLRRIQASIRVNDKSGSGTMDFSLRFKDVDKPVTINAPSSGKPIEELGQKLGEELGGSSSGSDDLQVN